MTVETPPSIPPMNRYPTWYTVTAIGILLITGAVLWYTLHLPDKHLAQSVPPVLIGCTLVVAGILCRPHPVSPTDLTRGIHR